MKNKIAIAVCAVALCGCQSYTHDRYDATSGAKIESTAVNNLLTWGKAGKITSSVKDGSYTRRVGVSDLETKGDTDFIRAVFEAGMETGKKVGGVP